MTDDEVRKYASPRPWWVKRAPWGSYLVMDANGEVVASSETPGPEIAEANATLMADGANALGGGGRCANGEQLEFDFESGHKADLVLYLANGLKEALSFFRSEFPNSELPDRWERLVDEGKDYVFRNEVHRQTFDEIIKDRCGRCKESFKTNCQAAETENAKLAEENKWLVGLLRSIVKDVDDSLREKLPTLLAIDIDTARSILARYGEG